MQLCLRHKEVKLSFFFIDTIEPGDHDEKYYTGMAAEKREVLSSEARSRGEERLEVWTPARPGTGLMFPDKWVIDCSLVSFDSESWRSGLRMPLG